MNKEKKEVGELIEELKSVKVHVDTIPAWFNIKCPKLKFTIDPCLP